MTALIVLGSILFHFLAGMLIVKRTLLRATRRIYAAKLAHVNNYHHFENLDRAHRWEVKRNTYSYVFTVLFFWEAVPFVWWAYLQLRASKLAIDQVIVQADPDYVRGLEISELGHHRIELSADDIVGFNRTHQDDYGRLSGR